VKPGAVEHEPKQWRFDPSQIDGVPVTNTAIFPGSVVTTNPNGPIANI
jgi:hypothetical protein